ncbi:MAG: CotH kinase family protein [Candidatus Limivicinus sp.]
MKNSRITDKIEKLLLSLFLLVLLPGLAACGDSKAAESEAAAVPRETAETAEEPDDSPSRYAGALRFSEIMVKNHASLMDSAGNFPDWIELENCSDEAVELENFSLSDGEDKEGWKFPPCSIQPGEFLLILAGGDGEGTELRTDFSISKDETLYLRDPEGKITDTAECSTDKADAALALDSGGTWQKTFRSTPGFPNTPEGYIRRQESFEVSSPLIISEVMVYNNSILRQKQLGFCDWVEVKNISGGTLELSDYFLSDDNGNMQRWRFPTGELAPGAAAVVICDTSPLPADKGYLKADFALSSDGEELFLADAEGRVLDFALLRDIPNQCSYGRENGENGWFFFDAPSPGEENAGGCRRISSAPVSMSTEGIFDNIQSLEVELQAEGKIYCTFDGSLPTEDSFEYKGPVTIDKTTVLRAVAVEDNALPSRPLTLNFIINEGHSLPVLSLASDSPRKFSAMYSEKNKSLELPGNIAFFDGEEGFNVPCGIGMHGETSLELPKKNMSLSFRGAYGKGKLKYDIYGGGVAEFSNLVLRAGQDFTDTIVRNELLENLALQTGDNVLTQRNRHCVLYINGHYCGIYNLTEKLNEAHYAHHRSVSPGSVTVTKSWAGIDTDFYNEVILFARGNDLREKENYDEFCRMVDIDSLIDWIIMEGYSANTDISSGNIRYCRSTEDDGKWRFMLFDMDATLRSGGSCFGNVLRPSSTQCAVFISQLMENDEFRDRFLRRAAELLEGPLSNESLLAELERLTGLISGEVERDYDRFGRSLSQWQYAVENLRSYISQKDWKSHCEDCISQYFSLSGKERAEYFGQ